MKECDPEALSQKQETANTVCAWPGPLFCIWGVQTDKQTVGTWHFVHPG